jgi:mannose-6-phosphate isomerase-like protein (cupin superfamily)
VDVTLFTPAELPTTANLAAVPPADILDLGHSAQEYLYMSEVLERAAEFDLIHNHLEYLPLPYSRPTRTPIVTTLDGAPSPEMLPVYEKYNGQTYYVSTTDAGRRPELDYLATVYWGISPERYRWVERPGEYLLFLGSIHRNGGVTEAIDVAQRVGRKLIIAGAMLDQAYFDRTVAPHVDEDHVQYISSRWAEECREWIGGAYALLHVAEPRDTFPFSLLEAMAYGTPVVAWDRGASPEIVEHETTGFLVNNVDEAVKALKRIPDIDRAACRRVVEERFGQDRMVSDYLRVYEQILERERARRADTLHDRRPWGEYWVLEDTDTYKVKRIDVLPGQRLSYQKHTRRSEHWFIVKGTAKVTLDGQDIIRKAGEPVDVPAGTAHRIENIGDEVLTFIEVQHGTYFGEDDIIRLQDDYGRIPQ